MEPDRAGDQTMTTNTSSAKKATHEVFTSDGFYSCGTLAQCKRTADEIAARGEQVYVYAAKDLDTVVYDPCAD